ncbi:hypothetical protein TIFTF001_006326 [Ficus carica]|uniref:Uncharacterized protein n=1 Tax=Ficus carica TaxID=3494 RepID=A0AA87ZP05_FICCA|nr:hypothetical protein TIFTF001_006326 [Ficus carica]
MASTGIYLLAVCIVILNTAITGGAHYRSPERHVALFVFGDSLYDPGNNNYINTTTAYQANFWPYGETFFGFPTGRFSNGRLIPDFISEYAKLPLIEPYLKPGVHNYANGVNFASGGAGALVESHHGFVVDLKTQFSYYKKVEKQLRHNLGDREAKELISQSVYLFSVGSNDYPSHSTSNSGFFDKYSTKEYVGMVLGNLTQILKGIYNIGGRKFGFVNLPPFGCFPGIKILQPGNTGACSEEVNSLLKLHNRELSKTLRAIQSQLKGFKEAETACCGSGRYRGVSSCGGKSGVKEFELCDNVSDYFFFDSVHPTEKAYEQLAKLMWSGDSGITEPYNLKELFEF